MVIHRIASGLWAIGREWWAPAKGNSRYLNENNAMKCLANLIGNATQLSSPVSVVEKGKLRNKSKLLKFHFLNKICSLQIKGYIVVVCIRH